jgi:hypothetical protein
VDLAAAALDLTPDVPFVKKPFLIGKLIGQVEELLARLTKMDAGAKETGAAASSGGSKSFVARAI